ncbi:MAG: aminoacyl-histidine dipeptidase [Oscillospiraceae bacterium]|nr:aminoacyl-histidine dipeptidase [Oscillospiraceae bacterium]
MNVLSGLEPKNVFHFFEQLCAIPHGSYHTKAISDYLAAFARERGLKYRQDEANNVIIWKGATPGYENAPTVMIQGHMDMVCEKDPDCAKDMEKESLDLFVDGDEVGARGTTLGGDDGIAVAMGLAILDADDIAHGPLECLFTVDEEVGMIGARALDASDLKAKYMLNIDSEEEKVLTVSCAGSTRAVCTLPVTRQSFAGETFTLTVDGLIGGHSGEEIHKGRANSNILMGRALYELSEKTELRIVDVHGGTKDNAIPRDASAVITVADAAAAQRVVTELDAALKNEFHTTDSGVSVRLAPAEAAGPALDADSTRRVICFLFCAPNGVQMMSADVPGLVQTSLNLGQVFTEEDKVTARFMVRSSVNSQKDETTERVAALTKTLGGSIEIPASYSAWEYRPDSPLRDVTVEAFRAVYGEEPTIAALHAGLECGILSGKMPELDCISFGPDLTNIHTPRERLHIASTQRVWKLTLETLKRLR